MDYNKIDLNYLRYSRGYGNNINVLYNGKKLNIKTPILKCNSKIIEESKNKYVIYLNLEEVVDFSKFLSNIEINIKNIDVKKIINKNDEKDEIKYISFIKNNKILKVKIPYRYNKFELNIVDIDNNILTSSNIIENINIQCNIELKNIWIYNNLYGCIWIMKEICIIE